MVPDLFPRDLRLSLVRVTTLFSLRVNLGSHVIVSRACDYIGVGISRRVHKGIIDLAVRASARRASVDVIAHYV